MCVFAVEGAEGPKKKKACKNCTCGLADELDDEADKKQQQQESTPSCGNVRVVFTSLTSVLSVQCWSSAWWMCTQLQSCCA